MYSKMNKVCAKGGTGFICEHSSLEYDTLSLRNWFVEF